MIFTPDPLKRAKREYQEARNALIDAKLAHEHARCAEEFAAIKVCILKNTIRELEKENAPNSAD